MKTIYLDCISGISGDMTLSALIDLGADISYIRNELEKLPLDAFTMEIVPVIKQGISASYLQLDIEEPHHHHHDHDHHHHRKAAEILQMIEQSALPERVKDRSRLVFEHIAEAEGHIHGIPAADVHFHEVGAMDSIIDVIGVCLAFESLDAGRIIASPVPTGQGKIRMAHGLYPIPAPATAELLTGIPLASLDVEGELTTPTGAGFLKALADSFGSLPPLPLQKIGYGAGKKDFAHPNVLRAVLFEEQDATEETVYTLECQVDDISGEALGSTMNRLFQGGALDVYYTPVYMKKNRPGTLLTVLCRQADKALLESILFRETTTFGVRSSQWERRILSRRFETLDTKYGPIAVKLGFEGGTLYQVSPEYADVEKASIHVDQPFVDVYAEIKHQAQQTYSS